MKPLKSLFVVTEYYAGGELINYVSGLDEDIRSEDISRIAFQLFSAIDHCHAHGVIHRDIKPESVMLETTEPGASLRLIDFGSGTVDKTENRVENALDNDNLIYHTTFAGSAFYMSPEMFKKEYTALTDVFSVGVVLYVVVA
jgi:serine/threonine protein kinase